MYRPITMYQIVCDRCGEVFGGTDTCSALFSNKEVDIDDLLSGDYYVGKYDRIFVMEKRKNFFRRMIKNCDKRIEELKSK